MGSFRIRGSERFEILRELGSGTAGVVYEAWDGERERLVALKVLHQSDPAALYRFKQEFRALAHLQHPNLVELYELRRIGDQWLVSMELVDGVDFIQWVRRPETVEAGADALLARLLPAARQLAEAVAALHAAGRVHRDVKPKNVLVDKAGRLRLLDFGLITKTTAQQTFKSDTSALLGTPAYMAPEQGTGDEVSEATDWYAVGVLLYEALTGRTPFTGQFVQVMLAKGRHDPAPISRRLPAVDPEIDALVSALLRRDPLARPAGAEVLRRLGARPEIAYPPGTAPPLVGREAALAELEEAFAEARSGTTVTVWVHGAAGLGKTALVESFLAAARRRDAATVTLGGRCFEHESVPYKAFDSVIDALTRFLRNLPYEETAALLPDDVRILTRIFPVLERVEAVASARRPELEIPDSRERRRRAFAALRQLLGRLAEKRPLIVFVDDLQWGDFDSAVLLTELLRPPGGPALLFIGAFRDQDVAASPLLQALGPGSDAAWPARMLEIGELNDEAATELARRLLGEADENEMDDVAETARKIVREAHGSARFVAALAEDTKGVLESGEAHGAAAVRPLVEVLRSRTAELSVAARTLVEVLAVAGRPLVLEVARRVAALEEHDVNAVNALRLARLARSSGVKRGDRLEIFDDHIAVAVRAALTPERRRHLHGCLARELAAAGGDAESLSHDFAAAGEMGEAFQYAVEAAEEAADALAFERAARLYRRALELAPEKRRSGVSARLAAALANAGRSGEAAEIYQRLAAEPAAPATESLEMRRRAAEHWLISGHLERGLAALHEVLGAIGLEIATGSRRAGLEAALRRAFLAWRGYDYKPRPAAEISPGELLRVDTCWSAAIGLGLVDTARGALFQARHLAEALRVGEPYRVARALALEASYSAAAGPRRAERTRRLIKHTARLTERLGHPHAGGLAVLGSGLAAYLEGRFESARKRLEKASRIFRERCAGAMWEQGIASFFTLCALVYRGELEQLKKRWPHHAQASRERGDRYALMNYDSRLAWLVALADDEPARAATELEEAADRWPTHGFYLQHLWCLMGRLEVDLYRGDAAAARQRLAASWERVEGSQLLRMALLKGEILFLRGRLELVAAREEGDAPARRIKRLARRLVRQRAPWSQPFAELLRSGLAARDGKLKAAARHAALAAQGFNDAEMALHAAVARHRYGTLSGDAGRETIAAAERWLKAQGVRAPARFVAWLAPGPAPDG